MTHFLRFNENTFHFELFSNAGESHSPVLTSFCVGDLVIDAEKQGINDFVFDVDVDKFPNVERLKSKSRALSRSIDRTRDRLDNHPDLEEKLSCLNKEHSEVYWLIDCLEAILEDNLDSHVATCRFNRFMNRFPSELEGLLWLRDHKLSSHQVIWVLEREPHILDDLSEFEANYSRIYDDVTMAWYNMGMV